LNVIFVVTLQIVIFESVLSYIERSSVQSLLTLLQNHLSNCLVFIYDPLLTLSIDQSRYAGRNCICDELSKSMEVTFRSRSVPILFSCRTPAEMKQFLHYCRFDYTISMTINQLLATCLSDPDVKGKMVDSNAEPFDEFASLAALHRTYSMSCCSNSEKIFNNFIHELTAKGAGSLEKYIGRRRKHIASSICRIRLATASDAVPIAELFCLGHENYVSNYKAVRSHVKHAKSLIFDTLSPTSDKNSSKDDAKSCRFFYVAEEISTNKGLTNYLNMFIVIVEIM
jgi:hypothetical protein